MRASGVLKAYCLWFLRSPPGPRRVCRRSPCSQNRDVVSYHSLSPPETIWEEMGMLGALLGALGGHVRPGVCCLPPNPGWCSLWDKPGPEASN